MVKSIFEQLGVHMSGMGITLSLALSYPPKKKSLMQVFISNLQVRTHLFANLISNFIPVTAFLPYDREKVISELQYALETTEESEMQFYRKNIKSLG